MRALGTAPWRRGNVTSGAAAAISAHAHSRHRPLTSRWRHARRRRRRRLRGLGVLSRRRRSSWRLPPLGPLGPAPSGRRLPAGHSAARLGFRGLPGPLKSQPGCGFLLLEVKHVRESGTRGLGLGCVSFISCQVGAPGREGNLKIISSRRTRSLLHCSRRMGVLKWQAPDRLAAVWMLLLNKSHLV